MELSAALGLLEFVRRFAGGAIVDDRRTERFAAGHGIEIAAFLHRFLSKAVSIEFLSRISIETAKDSKRHDESGRDAQFAGEIPSTTTCNDQCVDRGEPLPRQWWATIRKRRRRDVRHHTISSPRRGISIAAEQRLNCRGSAYKRQIATSSFGLHLTPVANNLQAIKSQT